MSKKDQDAEYILLDARVLGVIDVTAFRAQLRNGHELVAFVPRARMHEVTSPSIGQWVRVRFSPYDMSRAEMVDDGQVMK